MLLIWFKQLSLRHFNGLPQRSVSGECRAHQERAGAQERCSGVSMVAEAAVAAALQAIHRANRTQDMSGIGSLTTSGHEQFLRLAHL
jgi:hypothetical protein